MTIRAEWQREDESPSRRIDRLCLGAALLAVAGLLDFFSISTLNEWRPMGGPTMFGPSPRLYGLLAYLAAVPLLLIAFRLSAVLAGTFGLCLGGVLLGVGFRNLVNSPPFSGAFFMQRGDGELWESRIAPSLGEHLVAVALAGFILYAGLLFLWFWHWQSRDTGARASRAVTVMGSVVLYVASWVVLTRYVAAIHSKIEWEPVGTWSVLVSTPYLITAYAGATAWLLWKRPLLGASMGIPGIVCLITAVCLVIAYELG